MQNDGIYFEIFAMKNGVRYNIKIMNSRDIAKVLTNNLMNGVEEIISFETKTKEMVGDDQ